MGDIISAVFLAVIEGITEFLPISSTGHLIIFEKIFTLSGPESFQDTFLIVIQFPAILAVLFRYRRVLLPLVNSDGVKKDWFLLWMKIFVAFLPAGVVGLIFDDFIDYYLFSPGVVAVSLLIGGIVMILFEHVGYVKDRIPTIRKTSFQFALGVGIVQCIAMIPGVSRSAATIIGALIFGASRTVAVEFSFYLAIPTLAGASFLRIFKHGIDFTPNEWMLIIIGSVISFLVSYIVIIFFIEFVKRKGFSLFGWYRILVGVIIIFFSLFF
ncbi:MAG: undecaprenyl-diphosphate phosphatase [Candidatus Hydrogenedentes bacterium]|nr:undecaprenyl-diphosphate phosphatase [Candidatus Hydrogenedentota bacterium]